MILSLGSYEVLRIKENRIVTDSIWGKVAGFWPVLSSNEETYLDYQWVPNDAAIGYTLVSMEYNSDTQNISAYGLTIYDINGKIIEQKLIKSNIISLNLTNFKSSIYMHKITEKDKKVLNEGSFIKN